MVCEGSPPTPSCRVPPAGLSLCGLPVVAWQAQPAEAMRGVGVGHASGQQIAAAVRVVVGDDGG